MRKRAPGICSPQASSGDKPLLDAHLLELDFKRHLVNWGYGTDLDDAEKVFQRRYALNNTLHAQGAIIDLLLQRSSSDKWCFHARRVSVMLLHDGQRLVCRQP
mmetsp:Transcript_11576/g.22775  ORF Transcript_11576/g.22775 Transcript_11576/m.22775 type:complete len:103 (-) Transcript_11576:21-329(-)